MSLKTSNDIIKNRTRDLPVCSVLPLRYSAPHCRPVVHKMCSADPNGSTTGSQEIRGYISVMVTLKFNILLKIITEIF